MFDNAGSVVRKTFCRSSARVGAAVVETAPLGPVAPVGPVTPAPVVIVVVLPLLQPLIASAENPAATQQVGGGEAVHAGRGVDPRLAGRVVDDGEHRATSLERRLGLGRVGRPERVRLGDSDRAGVQAASPPAHPGGARSPASRVSRRTRLREAQIPRRRRRAQTLRWPSPTNGESAIARRISPSSARSVMHPTGPGRRRAGAEALRRRRCSHAADLDTPATRQTRASGASSRLRRSAPR